MDMPVKLAKMAMGAFPRVVSPDDSSHAAFFEPSHLSKLTQGNIDSAMYAASHNRCLAEEANPFLEQFFPNSVEQYFRDKRVLDFGCAFGGTAVAWEKMYGTKQICGFDVPQIFIDGANRYAKVVGSKADFRQGVGEKAPFSDGEFDTIVAIDVFEHVYDVEKCLKDCWRMLAPNGHLIAIFPTFYHPFEHHLKVSRTPLVHYFFSGKTLRKALNEILEGRGPDFLHFQADDNPNYKIPDLNGITVGGARKIIRDQKWEVVRNENYGWPRVGRRAQSRPMKLISRCNSIFAGVPVLSEFFLDRVAVILRKSQ